MATPEDMIRQRQQAEAEAEHQRQADQAATAASDDATRLAQLQRLISSTLTELEAAGYPGAQLVKVTTKPASLLRSAKIEEIAAWEVCREEGYMANGTRSDTVGYLLRDGCLHLQGTRLPPGECFPRQIDMVTDGVLKLAASLRLSDGTQVSASSGRAVDPDAAQIQAVATVGWEATQAAEAPMRDIRPTTGDILREWVVSDPAVDRQRWQEGVARYDKGDVDDYGEMCASAELMCHALTHYLQGDVITPGDTDQGPEAQLAQTIWNVLVATLQGNDETSFGRQAEKQLRLALAAVRRGGHQSEDLGGSGMMQPIFDDQARRLIMTAALASAESSTVSAVDFHLGQWFRSESS